MNKDIFYHNQLLQEMMTAAYAAAEVVIKFSKDPASLEIKEKTGPNDYVTAADLQSQEAIKAHLKTAFPEIGFNGEEDDQTKTDKTGYRFIVDPTDGTTNFANGLATWAISIACVDENDEVVAAAIYAPCYGGGHGSLYTATKGGGAFLNGEPLKASAKTTFSKGVIFDLDVGRPSDEEFDDAHDLAAAITKDMAKKGCAFRSHSTIVLAGALVAQGAIGVAMQFSAAKPWDVAAFSLILKEAGGVAYNLKGEPLSIHDSSFISAGNQELYKAFRESFDKSRQAVAAKKQSAQPL